MADPEKCADRGCENQRFARGFCKYHYGQKYQQGGFTNLRRHTRNAFCSVSGCGKKHVALGFCGLHLAAWHAHGDPLVNLITEKATRTLELIAKAKKYKGEECLLWPFAKHRGRPMHQGRFVDSMVRQKPTKYARIVHTCRGGMLCINRNHFHWKRPDHETHHN